MRTGRTNDLYRRSREHARDPVLRDFIFEPVHRTSNYAQQRGLEQMLYEAYGAPLNYVRPVSPSNPKQQQYLDAANNFLQGGNR